jgi:hypothetical protein
MIDEEIFRPLYCEDNGAPCKSIRVVVAASILQALFDLTDAETQDALDYDLRWPMALGLDPCADEDSLSQRTLQYFRAKLITHDMAHVLFKTLTDKMIARLGVKTDLQRLDTTHILSNFARLSRLGLFCETLRLLLQSLRREGPAHLAGVAVSLRRRYVHDDGTDASYEDARASDSRRRLAVTARDAYRLREAFQGVELPADSAAAYTLLHRLVAEHCTLVDEAQAAGADEADADLPAVPVVVKEANTLTGAVLQTPHDPGVTYSGHKGQGYEALLSETCAPENAVQFITHVSLERSCESDADRWIPTLEALAARNIQPKSMLADTSFGSVENLVASAQRGVELIAPQPGGVSATASLPSVCVRDDEFTVQLAPSQPASTCPCGGEALTTMLRNTTEEGPVALLQMPTASCATCPRRTWCPAFTLESGKTWVLITLGQNLPSHRRVAEQQDVFRDRYRPRAGIEGTNSEVKRGQGLNDIRVRNAERVELALFLRVTACNVKRMLKSVGKKAYMAFFAQFQELCIYTITIVC